MKRFIINLDLETIKFLIRESAKYQKEKGKKFGKKNMAELIINSYKKNIENDKRTE